MSADTIARLKITLDAVKPWFYAASRCRSISGSTDCT